MTKRNRNPSYEDVLGVVENTSKPIKGIDEPKIIGDIEVEGWGWGWAWTVWATTIPTWLSIWTYDLISSSINFTPTAITINWWMSDWNTSISNIYITEGWITWFYTVWTSWWNLRYITNRAINLYDTATNRFQADFVEFIPWWVRIDITRPTNTATVEIWMVAYS